MDEITPSCEVCAGRTDYWITIQGYGHYLCRYCKHLFVFPRPSPATLESFYQKGDYYERAEAQVARLRLEARCRLQRLSSLAARHELDCELLDVGCASGIFLSEAIGLNWVAKGIERSAVIAARVQQRVDCEVEIGVFEEMIVDGAPFPIITAWEVIEHAIDPRRFIAALCRNVSPGGLVAISTPMSDGFVAKVLGRRFPMLTPPEHLSLFSARSLKLLALEHGLECVSWRSFSNITPDALAAGFSKFALGRQLSSLGPIVNRFVRLFGYSFFWLPLLIDRLGGGSEMEVVFRKSATRP